MGESRDGGSHGTATVTNLHAWKRARDAGCCEPKPAGNSAGTVKDISIDERIERIKQSIVRINALMAELRAMGGTNDAQGKDGSRR